MYIRAFRPRLWTAIAVTAAALISTLGAAEFDQAAATTTSGTYVPVAYQRVVPNTTFTNGETKTFTVLGSGGVPSTGVSAVVLDVDVVNASSKGAVQVWKAGTAMPNNAIVRVDDEVHPISNTVVVEPSASGAVSIYTSAGTTVINVDVQGYFTSSSSGAGFQPLRANVVDTSAGVGISNSLAGGTTKNIQVSGSSGVPSNATAVFANVTTTGSSVDGTLAFYPRGSTPSNARNVNFAAGSVDASGMILPLSSSGEISVDTELASGKVDLKVDVQGYFVPTTTGEGVFTALSQTTVVGGSSSGVTLASGATMDVSLDGLYGIDSYSVGGVVLDAIALNNTAAGGLKIYPTGADVPDSASVLFADPGTSAAVGVSSTTVVAPGASGSITIANTSSAAVDVKVVLQGWFTGWRAFSADDEAEFRAAAADAGVNAATIERGVYVGPNLTAAVSAVVTDASEGTATQAELDFLSSQGLSDLVPDDSAATTSIDVGEVAGNSDDSAVTDVDPQPVARVDAHTCPKNSSGYYAHVWYTHKSLLGSTIYTWNHWVYDCTRNGNVIKWTNRYDQITNAQSVVNVGKLEVNTQSGIGTSSAWSKKQREIKLCVTKFGCYATLHPWSTITVDGYGHYSYTGEST